MKATIIAPFVGSMIIFNKNIASYLDYSGTFLAHIGVGDANSDNVSVYLYAKLYYIYFGLFFIGLGSLIYTIFSPNVINEFGVSDEYVRSRTQINSRTLAASSFESVLDNYAINRELFEWMPRDLSHLFAYSKEIEGLTYSLLNNIYQKFDWDNILNREDDVTHEAIGHDGESNVVTSSERDDIDFSAGVGTAYMTASGYVDIDAMCRDMLAAPRVLWGVTIPLKDSALDFQADVYAVEYMTQDLALPFARLFCLLFYVLGFVILFIPSLETFFRVLIHLFIPV